MWQHTGNLRQRIQWNVVMYSRLFCFLRNSQRSIFWPCMSRVAASSRYLCDWRWWWCVGGWCLAGGGSLETAASRWSACRREGGREGEREGGREGGQVLNEAQSLSSQVRVQEGGRVLKQFQDPGLRGRQSEWFGQFLRVEVRGQRFKVPIIWSSNIKTMDWGEWGDAYLLQHMQRNMYAG